MLHTLTFRVFLLAVTTSVRILALDTFKKIWILQTRTRGAMDRAPGLSSFLCASARMLRSDFVRYLRIAERKAMASMKRRSHRVHFRLSYRIRVYIVKNDFEIARGYGATQWAKCQIPGRLE